jgi:hypothetical protein
MKPLLLAFLISTLALPARAEAGELFRVDFSNPAVSPSTWTLILHPDGSGHFHSERGNAPAQDPPVMEAPNVDRDIHLSQSFIEKVFREAQEHSPARADCESHLKVAFQGWKKLTYEGAGGRWSCEFNYSRDKQMQALGDTMIAVAATILEGARLEMLLQHDRLGLDKEMEYISDASSDGRLVQLCAIHDILERLADDDGVMERVRKRARLLLAKSEK